MPFKINQSLFEFKDNSILINGRIVDCPINVSQALTIFLQSDNAVVSKELLLKTIWGDIIVSDDSLFKIIQGVRQILTKADLKGTLVNVYGKGYKIQPKISITENTDVIKHNKFPTFKNIALVLFFLIGVVLLARFIINQSQESFLINSKTYHELKSIGKTEAPELFKLLKDRYSNQDLMIQDNIQIAYLKGLGYFKQGDFYNSIQQLLNAIDMSKKNQTILATADAYLLLARIYIFKAKYNEMWQYLDLAEKIYTRLSDAQGLSSVALSRGRYYLVTEDFIQSLEVFKNLMIRSQNNNDVITQINIYYNTSTIYQYLDNLDQAKQDLNQMLELALKIADGENLSKAYSSLASINRQEGNFFEAMKQANLTIRYAIDQNDTNRFQQSFSSLYNLLNELGHQQLAEHYLQVAIDFQNSRNSDGHLNIAELNLGIINLQKGNYKKAQNILETLTSYPLSTPQQLEAKAWLALTRYFQKDNIKAYSLSHQVYNSTESTQRTKLVAGIALVLADFELERYDDVKRIFEQLVEINKDKWLIEKGYFIDMALYIFTDRDDIKYNKYLTVKHDFNQRLNELKTKTKPEESFLKALDHYINTVFIP